MVCFSLATVSVAAAVALASTANALALPAFPNSEHIPFKIQACAADAKDHGFSNQYITLQHVGAGQNLLVMTSEASEAATFAFNETRVFEPGTNYPFSLDTTRPQAARAGGHGNEYTAPEGYRSMSLSASDHATNGMYTGPKQKGVEPFFYEGELPFKDFVICTVNRIAYFKGPANQMMWRTHESEKDTAHCSDVFLSALFYDKETQEFPKVDCKKVVG